MRAATLFRLALLFCAACFLSVTWFALDHANRAGETLGRFVDGHIASGVMLDEMEQSLIQARQIYAYMIDDRLIPIQEVLAASDGLAGIVEQEGEATKPALNGFAWHLARLRAGLVQIESMRKGDEYSDAMTQTVAAVRGHLAALETASSPEGLRDLRRDLAENLRERSRSLGQLCKRYLRAKPDRTQAFLALMDKAGEKVALIGDIPAFTQEAVALAAIARETDAIKTMAARLRARVLHDPGLLPQERTRQSTEIKKLWDHVLRTVQGVKTRHDRALRAEAEASTAAIEEGNRLFMLLPAGCLALALTLLLFARRRFLAELNLFKSAAGDISQGRLDGRMPADSGGLLSGLAESFNLMAVRLAEERERASEAVEKLKLSHSLLDARVRERTRELSLALDSLRLKDSFFQNSKEGFVVCDEALRIVDANQAMTRMTGYSLEGLAGLTPDAFCHKSMAASFREGLLHGLDASGRYEGEIDIVSREGRVVAAKVIFARLGKEGEDQVRHVGICLDVSAQKLQAGAPAPGIDTLTGLPDREALLDTLSRGIAESAGTGKRALILVGLDGFKSFNSTAGHAAGDALLKVAAMRLASRVRDEGTVARLDGDEFAVLAGPLGSETQAMSLARRALSCFREPFQVSGETHRLSASVGVSVYPGDGLDAQTLLKNSGLALLRAKNRGKGRIEMFTQELDAHYRERTALERDLHEALRLRRFEVHYQPILDVVTGAILGAEALLRWTRDGKPLSPAVFIPVCEELNIMDEVTAMLLDTVTRDFKQWEAQGLETGVSVNISAPQFCEPGFMDRISATLRARKVPCSRVGLEITETAIMQNPTEAARTLAHLRGKGHPISVDDFGTGYSSLRYLQKFPLTTLKIDRQFIKDMELRQSLAIVRATIAMARGLGLSVVAEGVETPRQLELLRAEGCDRFQGFLFSPALPARDFAALLAGQARPFRPADQENGARQA